jgi:hypothetical protein
VHAELESLRMQCGSICSMQDRLCELESSLRHMTGLVAHTVAGVNLALDRELAQLPLPVGVEVFKMDVEAVAARYIVEVDDDLAMPACAAAAPAADLVANFGFDQDAPAAAADEMAGAVAQAAGHADEAKAQVHAPVQHLEGLTAHAGAGIDLLAVVGTATKEAAPPEPATGQETAALALEELAAAADEAAPKEAAPAEPANEEEMAAPAVEPAAAVEETAHTESAPEAFSGGLVKGVGQAFGDCVGDYAAAEGNVNRDVIAVMAECAAAAFAAKSAECDAFAQSVELPHIAAHEDVSPAVEQGVLPKKLRRQAAAVAKAVAALGAGRLADAEAEAAAAASAPAAASTGDAPAEAAKASELTKERLLARQPCSGSLRCTCAGACHPEEWGPSLEWENDFKEQLREHLASCFPEKAGLVFTAFHRVAAELERSMGLPRRALRPPGPADCLRRAATELLGKGLK